MQNIQDTDLRLSKKGVYRINDCQPGMVIQCKKGILWVTQTGDGVDHILCDGDQFTSRKHGRLLIEALGESALRIGKGMLAHAGRPSSVVQGRAA